MSPLPAAEEAEATPGSEGTLIVGASLAGVAVAEELRAAGYQGSLTVVGDENELPYDRPPLSKQWLMGSREQSVEPQPLKPPGWYAENGVDLRLGAVATSLRSHEGTLHIGVSGGDALSARRVVITCGARPRRLKPPVGQSSAEGPLGPNYLRTVEDARRLRADLLARKGRLIAVGAGFIGLEAATAAHKRGWDVVVLERSSAPLSRVLPPRAASACLSGLPSHGVDIRCGVSVESYRIGDDNQYTVVLESGEEIAGDVMVVGIGTAPNTDWLQSSGIDNDGGILCDNQGRTSVRNVWAAGDVARWSDSAGVRQPRNEQWQSAREQARVVARSICGEDPQWAQAPYFWSEVFGVRIQMCGSASPSMSTLTVEDGDKQLLLLAEEDQMLAGALALNSPRWMGIAKRWLAKRLSVSDCRSELAKLSPTASTTS